MCDKQTRPMEMPNQHALQSFPSEPVPSYRAATLTEGGAMAHICLNGMTYTLRITRAGKLILTK